MLASLSLSNPVRSASGRRQGVLARALRVEAVSALFLVLPFCTALSAGEPFQERLLEVRTQRDRELALTAHRLGIAPARVERARTMLEQAMALVDDVGGAVSVAAVGDLWEALDRPRAVAALQRVVDTLREVCRFEPDPVAHDRATTDAHTMVALAFRLGSLQASEWMKDWPEAPTGESQASPTRLQSASKHLHQRRRFRALVETNLDQALDLLAELEQGTVEPHLRLPLISRLARSGRLEASNRLVDPFIDEADLMHPETAVYGLVRSFSHLNNHYPERLSDAVVAWARSLHRTQMKFSSPRLDQLFPEAVPLTSVQTRVLSTALNLNRFNPEIAVEALSYFPALRRRVESVGGITGFRRKEAELDRQRHNASGPLDAATLDSVATTTDPGELLEEALHLLNRTDEFYSGSGYDPDAGRHFLESMLRLADALAFTGDRLRLFRGVGQQLLRHEGRLSDSFIRQGWDLLDRVRTQAPEGHSEEVTSYLKGRVHAFKIWLAAASAWSQPARQASYLADIPRQDRFAVLIKLTTWLAHPYRLADDD